MADIKFELNREGVRELLRSMEVQDMLMEEAMSRAPDGCEVDVMAGRNRANARITASTPEAVQENLENNTLLKAIGS